MATEPRNRDLRDVHPSVYLLSDHLDAALAACEDLLTEAVEIPKAGSATTVTAVVRANEDLRHFLDRIRRLELAITARVVEARKRADELRKGETHLRPFLSLFASGTISLLDAVVEFADTSDQDFRTGNSAYAYMKSRGIIAPATASLDGIGGLAVTEELLLVTRIRLGTLMDLLAAFLDALETHYELFGDGAPANEAGAPVAAAARSAALAAAASAMRTAG